MPSDSDSVNRSTSLERFRLDCTWLRADDREYGSSHPWHGVHAHPAVAARNRWRLYQQGWSPVSATALFYSANGIGSQACDVYVTCDVVRCFLYTVSGLNWSCEIFGFVIWHFLHCCFLQIVWLWSLSIRIRITFNNSLWLRCSNRAGFESLCNDEVIDQCECASNLLFLHSLLILFFDDFWRRMQMFKHFWTGVLNEFGTLRLALSDTRRLLMPSSRLDPVDWRGLVGLTASLTLCCLHETMCSHWHVLLWKLLKMNWVYRI